MPARFFFYDTDKIRTAFEDGAINKEEEIKLLLASISGSDRTDNTFATNQPVKCAADAVLEIFKYTRKRNADKDLVNEANRALSTAIPNLDQSYISPSGYFRLHYTLSGTHAVPGNHSANSGTPEYVKAAASYFDHAQQVTCFSRGFRTPVLSDDDRYFDVYIYDLQGKYGITFPKKIYEMTKTKQRRASCKIAVDNNYAPEKGFADRWDNCLKVTAAHEFFHAVQYAYNIDADYWWKEATATWNEDEIYDDVNDYIRYIHRVFASPENSLEKTSYGGVVFAKYLSEHYGGYPIIRHIWDIQGSVYDTSTKAIDQGIKDFYPGRSLSTAFKNYAAYNFNPAQYYKDGHLWDSPLTIKKSYSSFPVLEEKGRLAHLSCNYHLFRASENTGNHALKIQVDQSTDRKYAFKLQCRKKIDNSCDLSELSFANGKSEITLPDFGETYKEICLIPINPNPVSDDFSFTFSASLL